MGDARHFRYEEADNGHAKANTKGLGTDKTVDTIHKIHEINGPSKRQYGQPDQQQRCSLQ